MRQWRLVIGVLAMSVLLSACFACRDRAHAAQQEARILAFTDFHGALEERGKDVGLPRFIGAIKAHQAAQPSTLLVAVGDLFTGSLESDELKGKPVLEGLALVKPVCSAVGNHEFDWGMDKLESWRCQGLTLVSANIRDASGKPPSGVIPFVIKEAGGLRIAFVGLTTTATPRITDPDNVRALEFVPPSRALAEAAAQARAKGAEVVVALAHLSAPSRGKDWPDGISPDIQELAKVPGVNAVVYGHSHEEHISRIGNVPVVQPDYRGRSLAVLSVRRNASAPGGFSVTAELDRLSERKGSLPKDPDAERILRETQAVLTPLLNAVEGRTAQSLPLNNASPTALGEMVCDALRAATQADVSIINGGSLRAGLDKGDITLRDIYRTLPFNNSIRTLQLNGAELRRALEHGIIAPGDTAEPAHFVQVSGVHVTYDATRPKGQRIVSLTLPDHRPITKDMTFRVATNSFLAKGGDGYPLGKLGRSRENANIRVRDAVTAYVRSQGTLPAASGWLQAH